MIILLIFSTIFNPILGSKGKTVKFNFPLRRRLRETERDCLINLALLDRGSQLFLVNCVFRLICEGGGLRLSDDNCLLLTLTVLMVTVHLPGHGPGALSTGHAAVGLRAEAGVVGAPSQTGRLDDQAALRTIRNTASH